jgi:hypothetical protein
LITTSKVIWIILAKANFICYRIIVSDIRITALIRNENSGSELSTTLSSRGVTLAITSKIISRSDGRRRTAKITGRMEFTIAFREGTV